MTRLGIQTDIDVLYIFSKVRNRLLRSIIAPSICWLCLSVLPLSDATGSLLTTSVTTGYSSLILTIQQSSLSLANFTSTYAGNLALLGNAILAIAGKVILISKVEKRFVEKVRE